MPGSGLGILRDEKGSSFSAPGSSRQLPAKLLRRVQSGELLIISKTNRQSTVHRRVRMDDIAVKKVDHTGRITGEIRLLGLFTSMVYMEQAARTPLLRRKLRRILQAEDLIAGSHDYKAIVAIFESFPRDELFQARADELRRQVMAVLGAEESKSVTLTVRLDSTGRNVSVLIAMPRDRFNVGLRERLQALLLDRYGGNSIDYHLSLGEMELAELFFTIHVGERGVPEVSFEQLEADIVAACRSWDDELARPAGGPLRRRPRAGPGAPATAAASPTTTRARPPPTPRCSTSRRSRRCGPGRRSRSSCRTSRRRAAWPRARRR